ncbi:MAG: hypothetical protein WCS79_10885 [Paludibacter sp.]
MKKLILLIFLSSFLYSCKKYDYWKITGKIPSYKNNDTVCFKDTLSEKIDTFKISTDRGWNEVGTGYVAYYEYLKFYYKKIDQDSTYFLFSISAVHDGTWMPTIGQIYYKSTYLEYLSPGGGNDTITINNVTYYKVLIYKDPKIVSKTIPNKISVNFENGIISYGFVDGRVYNLVSK